MAQFISPTQTATMVLPSPSQTPEQGNSPTQTATMVLPTPSQTPEQDSHQFANTDSHHGASH